MVGWLPGWLVAAWLFRWLGASACFLLYGPSRAPQSATPQIQTQPSPAGPPPSIHPASQPTALAPNQAKPNHAPTQTKRQTKCLTPHTQTPDVAESIGRELLVYGRRVPRAEMFARIDAVTADGVRGVADRFLYDQDVAIAAVGDTQFLGDYNVRGGCFVWGCLGFEWGLFGGVEGVLRGGHPDPGGLQREGAGMGVWFNGFGVGEWVWERMLWEGV